MGAVKKSEYVVQRMEGSRCPDCGKLVRLLTRDAGGPSFFLCDCGFVGEVGVGRVREEPDPELASDTDPRSEAKVRLHDFMSELSQDYWSAAWNEHLEFWLWSQLEGEPSVLLSGEERAKLRSLAGAAGGWWRFPKDGEESDECLTTGLDFGVFVDLHEWPEIYREWRNAR